MFVNCPHCKGLVALDRDYGEPPERCPLCDGAMAGLHDAPADAVDAVDTEPQPANEDAATAVATAPPALAQPPAATASAAPAVTGTGRRSRRLEWLAVPLLALALLLQLFLLQRDALAADPRWRPLLERGCQAMGCALPTWSEPQAIRLLQRSVQADPLRPGVLQVRMRLRNEAQWPQPWPRLQLTLSDVDGQPLASGLFAPTDYLGKRPARALLAPGEQIDAAFAVREPARASVAFDFQFLPSITECGLATGARDCRR